MFMMQTKIEQTIYTELTMLAETKSGYYAIPWTALLMCSVVGSVAELLPRGSHGQLQPLVSWLAGRKSGYYTIPGTALPGGTVVGWFQSCCYADRIDSSDRWYHCWSG
jgi:hypothetical protein